MASHTTRVPVPVAVPPPMGPCPGTCSICTEGGVDPGAKSGTNSHEFDYAVAVMFDGNHYVALVYSLPTEARHCQRCNTAVVVNEEVGERRGLIPWQRRSGCG